MPRAFDFLIRQGYHRLRQARMADSGRLNADGLAAWRVRLPHRPAASTANRAEPDFATDHVPTRLPAVGSVQGSGRGCSAPL